MDAKCWTRSTGRNDREALLSPSKDRATGVTESAAQKEWARKATNGHDRAGIELFVSYSPAGAKHVKPDGTHISTVTIYVLPNSSGTSSLASLNVADMPLVDPNYLHELAYRMGLRAGVRDAMSCVEALKNPDGSEAISSENSLPGIQPLTRLSTDQEIDD